MRTEAYVCDYCNELRFGAECVGVLRNQDIFDKLSSFTTVMRPEKADIHYCIHCYNKVVVWVAEREVNRKKDEDRYTLKLKELSYLLKSQCVANYDKKKNKIFAQVKKK